MAEGLPIDRSSIFFLEEVERNFSFLEALGFRRVRSEATLVRYESEVMNINVYHGRRSYEINAELESAKAPSERYSILQFLLMIDPKLDDSYRKFATHTRKGVAEGVRRLAGDLRKCIDAGMLQNRQLFSELQLQQKDLAQKYAIKIQLSQARIQSEAAWTEKNFGKFAQILSPLEAYLSPAELKKLEYSRKHE